VRGSADSPSLVRINAAGQLGTATAAQSNKGAGLSAAVDRLLSQVKAQQRENPHQQLQIDRLREQLETGG
jgi:creatinine amidohydrolase/Fe(II)-dependent formamide hydrolase-like protein